MVLPFEPLSLSFSHVNYYVPLPKVSTQDSHGHPGKLWQLYPNWHVFIPLCHFRTSMENLLVSTPYATAMTGRICTAKVEYLPWTYGYQIESDCHLLQTINTTDPDKAGRRLAVVEGTTMLRLLTDCSGAFQPGVLTALLGSSGAGKTTLMDVLCGRKTGAPHYPNQPSIVSHCVKIAHIPSCRANLQDLISREQHSMYCVGGKVTGSIMVGGFPKEERSFARIMGYCQQEDVHAPFVSLCRARHIR